MSVRRSSLLTAVTSFGNSISLISSGAAVSLPLIRMGMGNDDAWTAGMNEKGISLEQGRKGKRF